MKHLLIALSLLSSSAAFADTPSTGVKIGSPLEFPSGGRIDVVVPGVPAQKPAGSEVPYKATCYEHGTTPLVIQDKDGEVLFKIECP